MITLEEVEAIAVGFPHVTEGQRFGNKTWFVSKRAFLWERPFSKADLKRFGAEVPPSGPIVAMNVGDLDEKAAILAEGLPGIFTISHFDRYPAVLVQLDMVSKQTISELIKDAWLATASPKDAQDYLRS